MEYVHALKRRSIRITMGTMLVPFALLALAASWLV